MSLKINTEVEILLWQKHKVQVPAGIGVGETSQKLVDGTSVEGLYIDSDGTTWGISTSQSTSSPQAFSTSSPGASSGFQNFDFSFPTSDFFPGARPAGQLARKSDGRFFVPFRRTSDLATEDPIEIGVYSSTWAQNSPLSVDLDPYPTAQLTHLAFGGLTFDESDRLVLLFKSGQVRTYTVGDNLSAPERMSDRFTATRATDPAGIANYPEIGYWIGDNDNKTIWLYNTSGGLMGGQRIGMRDDERIVDIAWWEGSIYILIHRGRVLTRIVREVVERPKNLRLSELLPRYLRIGIIRGEGRSYLWSTDSSAVSNEREIPPSVFEQVEGIEERAGETIDIFTGHLLTINNFEVEDREGYSNSLLNPPQVTETLSSLTSSMTSFGGISIAIADPEIRKFFEGDITETTTQNPVRVYRTICGKRNLVWSGFFDGISISATHETTISCRPLMKKFDQLATFGFSEKTPRWRNAGSLIPIIACRLMPWSVEVSDHGAVGCEPWSLTTQPNWNDLASERVLGYVRGEILDELRKLRGNTFFKAEADTYRVPSAATVSNFDVYTLLKDYNNRLSLSMIDPSASPLLDSGPGELLNDIGSGAKSPARERANENAQDQLDLGRTPRYVSFKKDELTRSIVTFHPRDGSEDSGKMRFERGIMFAPHTDIEEAREFIRPGHDNYEHSLIPWGASFRTKNLTSSPHYEKFLIGTEDYPLYPSSDTRFGGIRTRHIMPGLYLLAGTSANPDDQNRRVARYQAGHRGYDLTQVFPSLKLGENYCTWTHIPLPITVGDSRTGSQRITPFLMGANLFPPAPAQALIAPRLHYRESDYDRSERDNIFAFRYDWADRPVHPLDSFFRTTQISPVSQLIGSTGSQPHTRWTFYTPHGISLCLYGISFGGHTRDSRGGNTRDVSPGAASEIDKLFNNDFYFLTQFTSFLTHSDRSGRHAAEIRDHHVDRRVVNWSTRITDRSYYTQMTETPTGGLSFMHNGINEIAMPRSKDMYSTEWTFEQYQAIRKEYLKVSVEDPISSLIPKTIYPLSKQPNPQWDSKASTSLRVMPAHPPPTRNLTLSDIELDIYKNEFPEMILEGNQSGAYYTTASYQIPSEVGYWDTSHYLNPNNHLNAANNFLGYYHHHQKRGKGVSPATFLHAIVGALGFEAAWDIDESFPNELSEGNPMQLVSNTGQTYRSLVDRTCPGLGKILRWSPLKNKVEIIDWLEAHQRSPSRNVEILFDENCIRFEGISHSPASTPSSITFENPDMLKGANTLEGTSDNDKLLARYVRVTSDLFIQGKSVNIKHATWNEAAVRSFRIWDEITDILGYRVNIVTFTVSTEVLLGLGGLGTLAVGSWVRLLTPAFSQGVADLFIVETSAGELETKFRAYRFLGVGIQNVEDNDLSVGSPPATVNDIPGSAADPDDVGVQDGADRLHRVYY